MARLKYLVGWTPTEEKKAFEEGNLYHDARTYVYGNIRSYGKKVASLSMVDSWVKAWLTSKEKEMQLAGMQTHLDEISQTLDHISVVIPAFFARYPRDLSQEWIYVEDAFSFPVYLEKHKVAINFKGKYDGGFMQGEGFWVEEAKFKGRWPDGLAELLTLDLQTCSYVGAAHKTGHNLKGCRYSVVRKPQLKKGKTESRGVFCKRVKADIGDRPNFYFERHNIEFGKAECEANLRRIKALINSFYEWWLLEDHKSTDLLFNSGACETVYGACEYLRICANSDTTGFLKKSGLP